MARVEEPLEYDVGSYAGVGGSEFSLLLLPGEEGVSLLPLSAREQTAPCKQKRSGEEWVYFMITPRSVLICVTLICESTCGVLLFCSSHWAEEREGPTTPGRVELNSKQEVLKIATLRVGVAAVYLGLISVACCIIQVCLL